MSLDLKKKKIHETHSQITILKEKEKGDVSYFLVAHYQRAY